MKPDFDKYIDRRLVPALKTHRLVLGEDGGNLFPAGVADMDFRVAKPITDALQSRLEHGIFGYETIPQGLMPALTNWLYNRHRWRVENDHILRSPNVLNSLAISASLFTDAGDGIIIQPPVFFDFFDIIKENHRTLVKNPLILQNGRYVMDFEGLEKLASAPHNKILFLCNPHNPIGRVWTSQELRHLGDICIRNNVLVVSDELHGDIVYHPNKYIPFASLGQEYADNSITVISPAKSFNIAGCCSSFTVISNESLRTAFQMENSRLTVNKNNALASVAMEAAYKNGELWLDAAVEYLQGNLDLVREKLQGIPNVDLIEPDGTFLLWLDFRALNKSPTDLTAFLRTQANWGVTRGIAFGNEGAGFERLNIACPKDKLQSALENLRLAVVSNKK